MKRYGWIAGSLLLLGLVAGGRAADEPAAEPLLCLVGGTMRPAVEELARQFEAAGNGKVLLDFSDSGQILIKVEATGKGDIYVVHDPFLAAGEKKNMVAMSAVVAALEPVIVVAKGNPKGIRNFADLARPGLRLVLTDDKYSTMGYVVSRMAAKLGLAAALASNVVTRTRGGGEAANAVALKTADASVVWNAVAFLRKEKLDAIPLEEAARLKPGVDAVTSATYGPMEMDRIRVTAVLLKTSKAPERAKRFVDFMASEAGRKVWDQFGFSPLTPAATAAPAAVQPGDAKAQALMVHCAAGMRKAIDKLARDFGERQGVKIELNADGSNRLLGQIQLSRQGDVYIAGDAEYVERAMAAGLATTGFTFCLYVPVIIVQKDNPLGIKTLADLLKPGVRIGQGDEKAAAIGQQTVKILARNKIDREAWNKNVLLNTMTVNELGAAIKLRTIDAALVWSSTAADYAADAAAVALDPTGTIVSDVQGTVLTCARDKALAQEFLDFLLTPGAQATLAANGYVPMPTGPAAP